MNRKALAHLKKHDPKLWKVAKGLGKIGPWKIRNSGNYFSDLCEAIVGQQLSGKAASTIWGRFTTLMPAKRVTPKNILAVADQKMRATGMSWAKVKYVRDLAEKVKDKLFKLDQLDKLPDEQVIAQLVKVKGIGPWTAEMFLMFTLGRPDIFSHGDLGLANAMSKIYNLNKPTHAEVETICLKWSPYRTFACRVLWRSLETRP